MQRRRRRRGDTEIGTGMDGRRMTKIGTEQFMHDQIFNLATRTGTGTSLVVQYQVGRQKHRTTALGGQTNFRVERINPIVSHWQEPNRCTPGFGLARVGKCEIEHKNIYEELVNML
jgi:hypothetical protein